MFVESHANDVMESIATTTIATSSRSSGTLTMAPAEEPKKFSSVDFKCWQKNMLFYLTTLCLQRFISENIPKLSERTPEKERFMVMEI